MKIFKKEFQTGYNSSFKITKFYFYKMFLAGFGGTHPKFSPSNSPHTSVNAIKNKCTVVKMCHRISTSKNRQGGVPGNLKDKFTSDDRPEGLNNRLSSTRMKTNE